VYETKHVRGHCRRQVRLRIPNATGSRGRRTLWIEASTYLKGRGRSSRRATLGRRVRGSMDGAVVHESQKLAQGIDGQIATHSSLHEVLRTISRDRREGFASASPYRGDALERDGPE
jgi:hypothetical protein